MKRPYIIGIGIAAALLIAFGVKKVITTYPVVIPEKLKPIIDKMISDAKKVGVSLSVGSGLRTYDHQLALRKANVIDKTKVNDLNYLKTEDEGKFNPRTARPGTSNHESGLAIDFNVSSNPKAYEWLVANALKYGFIRTVPSERWHWEYKPGSSMYAQVPKTDPTWKA